MSHPPPSYPGSEGVASAQPAHPGERQPGSEPVSAKAPPSRRALVLRIAALLAITLGSFALGLNPDWVRSLGNWGYLGIFFVTLLSSATVILPAPGLAVVFAMGAALDPVALGVIAGIGSGLGEISGYVAGASGRGLIQQTGRMDGLLRRFAARYTAPALFFFALLPLPIFDFAGILAGAMGLRIPLFLGAVIPGKIVKHVVVALVGAGSLPMLRGYLGF